jgi:arginase family enzyme
VFGTLRGRVDLASFGRDFGDVTGLGADVAANHRRAADLTRDAQLSVSHVNGVSLVVGGGHDHGYSQLLGVSEALAGRKLGCINLDAHLDVRKPVTPQKIGSGSPFYLAVESGLLDPARFTEFGIQPHCNGEELWRYAEDHKIKLVEWKDLRRADVGRAFALELDALARSSDAIVVSLDLDAAAQAHAPGVSAPQSEGFTAADVIEMAELAGAHPSVVSLGLFELNPLHDVDGRTARLAATAAHHFVASAISRKT